MKLKELVNDIHKKHILGCTIVGIYVSEFQKHGLPHAHIFIFFVEDCKPHTVKDVDHMISAKLSNLKTNRLAHETVTSYMVHGPCGTTFPNAPCIVTNPLWPSVGVKPNTWKSWRFGVLRDSRMFRARQQGPKHLALGCSWCHWKGLET
jgi:hypothetical protein